MTASIVVEWDNARLIAESRPMRMLSALAAELAGVSDVIEVLLVHGGSEQGAEAAAPVLCRERPDLEVIVVDAPGTGYYELKNVGAGRARGDLVVFLDCDIVPEPGWLREIVRPFSDESVGVVVGETHVDASTFWTRSLALAWVFEVRTDSSEIVDVREFLANNLAFRTSVALAHPFPIVEGTARGSCVALAKELAEAGIVVIANRAAKAAHPPPNGFVRAVERALVHGRDAVVLTDAGVGEFATLRGAVSRIGRILTSAIRDRQRLGLSTAAAPAAALVALGYYGVAVGGALFARLAPAQARRLGL